MCTTTFYLTNMQDVMHIMPCLHCYINLKAVAQGCAQSGLDGVAACVKLAVFFFFFLLKALVHLLSPATSHSILLENV